MADFATVAELEGFMGLASGSLGSRGTQFLSLASAAVRRFTKQDLEEIGGRQESYAGDAWRGFIQLTQIPVTAVSAITVDAVAFTAFDWTRWGLVSKDDGTAWDTGPILITYDSGFSPTSDEIAAVKQITLSVAARALGGNPETFGLTAEEVRGPTPAVFLTEEERAELSGLTAVAVG